MLSLGAFAFLNPWLLVALAALPALYLLLKATPPGPRRMAFPGVRLLLGLRDPEKQPERTPWWLLLLRILAVAAAILGFSDPVLNPRQPITGSGPVLVVLDGGWASAPDWSERQARVREVLEQAGRAGRPVALVSLADPVPAEPRLDLRPAADWSGRLSGMRPRAWAPDRDGWAAALETAVAAAGPVDTWYLRDGLSDALSDGAQADITRTLAGFGPLTVIGPERLALGLKPARLEEGLLRADIARAPGQGPRSVQVAAIGTDPAGKERRLALASADLAEGDTSATVAFDMPLELRNRITRLTIPAEPSAGAVTLTDEAIRRRKVGLMAGAQVQEGQQLVSPLHYLRQALAPTAEVIEAPLSEMLAASPDVLILADVGVLAPAEHEALQSWVDGGGLLIRFAGPRLAASSQGTQELDPLLPVRLREGGRSVGGAMSWGAPRTLRAFPRSSPFAGLPTPEEVTVTRQVMAQPDPDLPDRIWAALEDGTPLVTSREEGEGRVVLFHVTANAEWSSLPLSGLFVQMLERLAVSARAGAPDTDALEGTVWTPELVIDGYGRPIDASAVAGVSGARLAEGRPGPDAPPGVYSAGDRTVAINLLTADSTLQAAAAPPAGTRVEQLGATTETGLKQWFLIAAILMLAADLLATLWLGGRLRGGRPSHAGHVTLVLLSAGLAASLTLAAPQGARAQAQPAPGQAGQQVVPFEDPPKEGDDRAIAATTETVLAYVLTGDQRVDRVSAAGLSGLSRMLAARTAIEPGEPMAVNIETDELAFFPMLYWPIAETQPMPGPQAVAKLNAYLRGGGMIVFDTRDADLGAGLGTGTPNGKALQRIASQLDIPPLEQVPEDHVLTRAFYLLQSFPGRYAEGPVWVEAAQDPNTVDGMPFRNLNDGVTPVVIGSNDWAAAWALDENGRTMFPVGRALGGERQREMAWRFGINLVMHVMTGNYKSDQVHVPALLERLGQ
ncbi:DUF4159 domain-containing protein [Paroceanicella profunda]|uniref:DUF4159 domain-containing protein n=1 Tax=Paroceanicella profunda TaxID=2579971 RepID=A0A5B8FQD0_9RHOB|nr:DUF4159 domain-containing protein [Paroceanicella profunda]QDL90816.1 DUF4159 domain-containing protein [Paroceanicella profunda]